MGRFRSKAGAKKGAGDCCAVQTGHPAGQPFCSWQSYGAVTADAALYRNLRENIPILDAAIGKLVRLTGGFSLDTGSDGLNAQLNRALSGINVGGNQQGIEAFIATYLDQLLTYGSAVGEMITQIDGGIKKEVSVSCAMGSAVCSLCGADRRSGGCSHVPGRSYDGKVAFTVLSDATDAYEWSFVAVPAQREAGVVKHYDSSKGDKTVTENDVRKTLQNSKGAVTLTCDQARALARQLDTLEQEAQLGKSYKQELASQVVRLCAGVLPQMELGVFEGVARVMTAKELQAFKAAFEAADRRANMPSPQLASGGEKKSNNQAFVI